MEVNTGVATEPPPSVLDAEPQQSIQQLALKSLQGALAAELELTSQNSAAIQDSWRRILRLVKVETLRGDVDTLIQSQERDIDRRDARIEKLETDLLEVEDEVATVTRHHVQGVDALLAVHNSRSEALADTFKRSVQALEADFAADSGKATARHVAARTELQHVLGAARESEDAKHHAAQVDFEQVREGVRRRNLEQVHVLQSDMDSTIEGLEKAFEGAHLQYLQTTDARTADYKVLSERAQHDAQMAERQQRALKKLNRQLQVWRSKTANNARDWEDRNSSLAREKDRLTKHLVEQKASIGHARAAQLARLKRLSCGAQSAREKLSEHAALGQRVLGAMETVRRGECARERLATTAFSPCVAPAIEEETEAAQRGDTGPVTTTLPDTSDVSESPLDRAESPALPPESHGLSETTADGAPSQQQQQLQQQLQQDAVAVASSLRAFHARYNSALFEMLQLERERDRLQAEGQLLGGLLQQFMGGVQVRAADMERNETNSLLRVTGLARTAGR